MSQEAMNKQIVQLTRSRADHSSASDAGALQDPPTTEHFAGSPPAFQWEDWYAAVGGRTISIEEVNALQKKSTRVELSDKELRVFDSLM